MMRGTIATGWMLLLALAPIARAQDAGYEEIQVDNEGTIVGRVHFEDDFPEAQKRTISIDLDTCGTRATSERFVVDGDSKGLANAVLMIRDIPAGKPFAEVSTTIQQLECRYSPHVAVMRSHQDLNIVNNDPILHNVHAYRGKDSLFNLAQPTKGTKTTRGMGDQGVVHLKCDVHPWMSGYILLVNNPYVAISGADGRFEITGVPPGDYTLSLWHEALGIATKPVTVGAGESSEVDFPIGG